MAWKPDYASEAEFKSFARIGDADEVDDAELGFALSAASRSVDHACNRQFGLIGSEETRYYTARFSTSWGRYVVEIDDLSTADDLTVTSDGTAVTDYTLEPVNAAAEGEPFTRIVFGAGVSVSPLRNKIGATSDAFGWAAIPTTVKQATLIQASRFLKRRDAPFGIAGSPDLGNELRLLAKLDPDVMLMVKPYYRWWGAVT